MQTGPTAITCPFPEVQHHRRLHSTTPTCPSRVMGCLRLIATKGGGPGPHVRVSPSVVQVGFCLDLHSLYNEP